MCLNILLLNDMLYSHVQVNLPPMYYSNLCPKRPFLAAILGQSLIVHGGEKKKCFTLPVNLSAWTGWKREKEWLIETDTDLRLVTVTGWTRLLLIGWRQEWPV